MARRRPNLPSGFFLGARGGKGPISESNPLNVLREGAGGLQKGGTRGPRSATPTEFRSASESGSMPEGFSTRSGSVLKGGERSPSSVVFTGMPRQQAERPSDVPTAPTPQNRAEELEGAEDEQRKRESRKRGRASTILTGGQGLQTAAPIATRTLMGS